MSAPILQGRAAPLDSSTLRNEPALGLLGEWRCVLLSDLSTYGKMRRQNNCLTRSPHRREQGIDSDAKLLRGL
jgi:hypothetical protein